jgi:hypothetical protein
VIDGLRGRRPFDALVTFNTWYAYGTHIDEASMLAEIEGGGGAWRGAVHARRRVGTRARPARMRRIFSSASAPGRSMRAGSDGLRVLSDRAHELGLKFGIWIEPERVALSTVNQRVARTRSMARQSGRQVR